MNVLWAAPPPRTPRTIRIERASFPARMATLLCNDPGVIAYSVYWDTRIMAIHAHTDEKDSSMYKARSASMMHKGIWQYFPLHSREKVTEIWARSWRWIRVALIVSPSPLSLSSSARSYISCEAETLRTAQDKPQPRRCLWTA